MNNKPSIHTVVVDWQGFKLEITGQYEPEIEAIWNFSNGDPGIPGEPSNFYIESISLIEGELLEYSLTLEAYSKTAEIVLFEEELIDLVLEKIEK